MKVLFLSVILALFGFSVADSTEIKFPTPSYGGEGLAEVRKWEEQWAGKRITTETVDEVKDYLHESVYMIMKNPELLGAEKIWFEIVPYTQYSVSTGMIEATRKYAPDAALDKDENLVGYGQVAGIPFPEPETGIQMAWNFDANTRGDTHHLFHTGTIVDCRTKHERRAAHLRWEMYWVGRYDVPPLPRIPDAENPRGVARSYFQRHTEPTDFMDTTMLELRYQDPKKEEDLWVYTSMFRRIRRYATSQRTDTIDGTDMIYDDQEGWYTIPTRNTYTFTGREDLLVARHQQQANVERIKGQGFWNGFQRERVNHWVIEVVNKDPNYVYSRQIWYLDPETWQMNFKVMYNRQGELWKLYELGYIEEPSYGDSKTASKSSEHIVDLIRRHGSPGNTELRGVGIELPASMFEVRNLQKTTY